MGCFYCHSSVTLLPSFSIRPVFYWSTDYTDYMVFRILIKSLNTNITDLSNGFLSQQIAQLPSGWSCSPKVGELPVRVRGMSKWECETFQVIYFSTPLPRGHHPIRFPRYRGTEILFQGRSAIRSSPPSESIGYPFNQCNQLIIIFLVDRIFVLFVKFVF